MTTRWYLPDCYLPELSTVHASHESLCVLNDADAEAVLVIEAYFADREATVSGPIRIGPRSCHHLRSADPAQFGGLQIPVGVPYGIVVRSEDEIHLQYSRLDTTAPAYALMTAIPVPRP